MSISVHFFASLREQIGLQQTSVTYTPPMNVSSIWEQTSNGLEMPGNTLCAINMEYVAPETAVNDGDEIAFFPPVTGG